jgi:hypothetical protein
MDAVKFIEERDRMCKSFDICSCGLRICPAWDGSCKLETGTYLKGEADKMVKIVEEWSAAHPRKTRQSVFLEQYPEARMGDDGVLHVDPCSISASHRNAHGSCATMARECKDCRREFWMQEVE